MTYENLLKIALVFRPALCALALLLAACQCSEKCNAFWPPEMVPHIEINEIKIYKTQNEKKGES